MLRFKNTEAKIAALKAEAKATEAAKVTAKQTKKLSLPSRPNLQKEKLD